MNHELEVAATSIAKSLTRIAESLDKAVALLQHPPMLISQDGTITPFSRTKPNA
jgi:hypothetical protein